MKAGFLLRHSEAQKPQLARTDSAQEAGPPAAAAQGRRQAAAAAAAPAAATPEQAAAGLAECLQLLRGPTDERRFVGLLLVTRLLPAGDAEAVRQVHAAVGPTFLTRLLLPLKSAAAPVQTAAAAPPCGGGEQALAAAAAAAQKEAATCALGLAVLSSFARVPDLAASTDMVERLPLLLNVVRAGGIGPLLAARHGGGGSASGSGRGSAAAGAGAGGGASAAPPAAQALAGAAADPAADAAAVVDALECAVAVACSGAEGATVAAESGALGAAVAALSACPPTATQQLSLALQLLAAVLADEGRRLQLLAGDSAAVLQQLLPALARVFALPAQQLTAGSGRASASASGEQGEELQRRLLALQLEALHVLLLVLPLPPGSGSTSPGRQAAAVIGGAPWPAQLRQGLALLLRGRISAVQRHSALQLAAAVVDLLGPGWLLGSAGLGACGPAHAQQRGPAGAGVAGTGTAEAQAFFQLLVEITKVETSVLLHDALAPDVPVPLASAPAPAAGDWRPPAPRHAPATSSVASDDDGSGSEAGQMDGNHAAGAALAADLAGGDGGGGGSEPDADMEPLVRVLSSEEDRRQLAEQLQREQQEAQQAQGGQQQPGEHMRRVDETRIPAVMHWEGPSEASGARAARVLPCCFALLEACVEALAVDTQLAEAMLEVGGSGGPAGAPSAGPVLSDAVAQRALTSLQEAVEVVLQFIEQSLEGSSEDGDGDDDDQQEGQEQEQGEAGAGGQGSFRRGGSGGGGGCGSSSPLQRALLLAALRALARFCAEVPDAFGSRLRPLLPRLLSLRVDFGGGLGGGDGSSSWGGADSEERDDEMEAEAEAEMEGGGASALGPAEGTTFLLPVLLQVSDPGGSGREHQLWLDALAELAVLRQLAQYTRDCAASCSPAVTTAAAAAADDALLYACQLLLNILAGEGEAAGMGLEQRLELEQAAAARQRLRRRQLLRAGQALPLLRALLRVAQMRPLLPPQECSPTDVVSAARLLSALSALCAVIAASVAEELHSGASSAGLGLQLSPEEEQLQSALEEAEEEAHTRRHLRRRGAFLKTRSSVGQAAPPAAPAAFLGPISGRAMQAVCWELLHAIRVAAQLTAAGALGGDADLAASVAADEALHAELRRHLDVAASEAAVLLRHYPPWAGMCAEDEWLGAELAAAGSGAGSCCGADVSRGLALFLGALGGVMNG